MARVDVVMPKMGESVMEGTVLEWKKAVGETVEQDETLLEISTDKVDSEVPSPSAGRIVEILVEENDTVDVGTAIAIIETDVDAPVGGDSASGDAPEAEVEEAAEPLDVSEPAALAEVEPAAKPAAPIVRTEDAAEAAASDASGAETATAPAPDTASAPAAGGVEVVMPKMGESVMEGTVLEWKKAVGDEVEQDETLLEISTDKVDSEVPSPAAGTLVQILVEEGETVDVGTPIAIIGSAVDGEVASPAVPEPVQAAAHTEPAAPEASGDGAATDAPEPAEKSYGFSGEPGGPGLAAPATDGESDTDDGPIPRRDDQGNFYSPLVRSIAETEGLSLSELQGISGTGAESRLTKADVMAYLDARGTAPAATPEAPAAPAAQPAPVAPAPTPVAPQAPAASKAAPSPAASGDSASGDGVEVIHMDRMRQLIADHMTRSQQTSAHVTSFTEIDVTGLVAHRNAHKAEFQQREGVKLTYTPYFIHAAIEPLRAHPLLNSSVEGTEILVKKAFHIGIAVTIGTKGLLVPVVRNAGQQNLTGLTHTIGDLAERARTKKLQPDELQGGTFTITNVGSLGSLMGTPIINQPQVAILSPGAIVKRPVVMEDPTLGDVIAIRHMMYVSLSYDHRIIDGSMAASFLAAYRASLESITAESQLV